MVLSDSVTWMVQPSVRVSDRSAHAWTNDRYCKKAMENSSGNSSSMLPGSTHFLHFHPTAQRFNKCYVIIENSQSSIYSTSKTRHVQNCLPSAVFFNFFLSQGTLFSLKKFHGTPTAENATKSLFWHNKSYVVNVGFLGVRILSRVHLKVSIFSLQKLIHHFNRCPVGISMPPSHWQYWILRSGAQDQSSYNRHKNLYIHT